MIGDEQSPNQAGRDYLLLIGIDTYTDGLPPLHNARRDTETVGQVLQERYQFADDLTTVLYDDQATGQAILDSLAALRQKITPADNLVIYFAGHGWYDTQSNVGYWLPVDAKQGKSTTFLSFSVLRDELGSIDSWHTVILADSCYAGTLFLERDIMGEEIALERLAQYPSRYILAAGRNEPVADGAMGGHSPFAGSLIDILKHHRDGLLPVTELTMLIIRAVGANANQLPRGEPMRNVGHRGGVFMFRLKGQAAPTPLPEPKPGTPSRSAEPTAEESAQFKSLPALKKALIKHLSAGDLERALQLFDRVMSMDSYYFNDIILLQARFNDLSAEARRGILLKEQESVERNRIYYAALDYVKMLEESDVEEGVIG
jgi:hypothetical protein